MWRLCCAARMRRNGNGRWNVTAQSRRAISLHVSRRSPDAVPHVVEITLLHTHCTLHAPRPRRHNLYLTARCRGWIIAPDCTLPHYSLPPLHTHLALHAAWCCGRRAATYRRRGRAMAVISSAHAARRLARHRYQAGARTCDLSPARVVYPAVRR